MENTANYMKSVFTPCRQNYIHGAANMVMGATAAIIGARATAYDNDPALMYFGFTMFGAGSAEIVSTFSLSTANGRNAVQFFTSLANLGTGMAGSVLANKYTDPTLMAFAWASVAVGTAGLSVQATREFECIPCPEADESSGEEALDETRN